MQKLESLSQVGLVGTWRGVKYPDMPSEHQQLGLHDLLAMVARAVPHFENTPEIARLKQLTKERLFDSGLRSEDINRLVSYHGNVAGLYGLVDGLPNLNNEFWHILESLRSAKQLELMRLLESGALGYKGQVVFDKTNRILDTFSSTFSARLRGGLYLTGTQTMTVQNVVVGASYATPASNDTSIGNQIGSEKTPDESVVSGYQTTFITFFRPADNNGLDTTVTSGTSTTVFNVTSISGLSVGDAVMVTTTSGDAKSTIAAINGLQITLSSPAQNIPQSGNRFLQCWGRAGLKINSNGVLGTANRFADGGFEKDALTPIIVESAITLRPVGE